LSTTYIEHYIHWALHTLSTTYIEHYIHWALHTLSTTYIEHYIHWALHTLSTTYIEHYIHWALHTLSVPVTLIVHHVMQYLVLYWNLCPVRLFQFFAHYLTNETIFGKKNISERKLCLLIFSSSFVWNFSDPWKNSGKYYYKFT